MRSGIVSATLVACGFLAAAPASAQGVKIGILNDQSGVYADYGGKYSLEAAHMAVEDFGGSVLGKKIEIVFADNQNKPDIGVGIVRRWLDNENVDVIVDGKLAFAVVSPRAARTCHGRHWRRSNGRLRHPISGHPQFVAFGRVDKRTCQAVSPQREPERMNDERAAPFTNAVPAMP